MAAEETLVEHLMWQVRLSNFSQVEEDVAEYIVRSLSPSGYLRSVTVPQIARRLEVSTLRVEEVLRRVQQLDPWPSPRATSPRPCGSRPGTPSTRSTIPWS
ncbi:hypothetical protein G6O69_36730 [Pseudenhygromyxa sp. WMMC2535]|nr:hypothetical protein [Pseudenhygromyxa sp. WMMC2535]